MLTIERHLLGLQIRVNALANFQRAQQRRINEREPKIFSTRVDFRRYDACSRVNGSDV